MSGKKEKHVMREFKPRSLCTRADRDAIALTPSASEGQALCASLKFTLYQGRNKISFLIKVQYMADCYTKLQRQEKSTILDLTDPG